MSARKNVDARHKAGHDSGKLQRSSHAVIARSETTTQSSFLNQRQDGWIASLALAMTVPTTSNSNPLLRHGREARSSLRATSRPSTSLLDERQKERGCPAQGRA